LPLALSGEYIYYNGQGVQNADGSVRYDTLHCEIWGFRGALTFPRGPDYSPGLSGSRDRILLAQGELIPDAVNLTPKRMAGSVAI